MRYSGKIVTLGALMLAATLLSGCVYSPAPGYGYGYGYYAPPPPAAVYIGGGWGGRWR